jgi:hypothetical protein
MCVFLGWHAAIKGETSQRLPGNVCLSEQGEGQPPYVALAPGHGQSPEAHAAAARIYARSEGEREFFLSDGCWVPSFRQRAHTAAPSIRATPRPPLQILKVRWSRLRWSSATGEVSALDDSEEDSDHR